MKKILIIGFIVCLGIVLGACGEKDKYNEAIEMCLKEDKKLALSYTSESEQKEMTRNNSNIKVYDDGKYVYINFTVNDDEGYFKRKSDGSYDMGTYDDEEYMKNDAKLVYSEKNGKPQKIN